MKPLTVISDPGVDDAVALVLLEKLAPEAQKLLVATFGNNTARITGRNAADFAAYMQKNWRYRPGAALPNNKKVECPWPDYFHGPDGLWGVRPPRATKKARRTRQQLVGDLISLGPLTETYQLLKNQQPKRLIIMGGAFGLPGNETTYAETNIAMDPDAARLLFRSCQNTETRVVPMDVTQQVRWSLQDVRSIPETSPTNRWLKQLLLTWYKKYEYAKEKEFVLYDPLAVYLAFVPQAATWTRRGIAVVPTGPQRGRTIFSDANPPCKIALNLLDPQAVAQAIYQIIFGVTR